MAWCSRVVQAVGLDVAVAAVAPGPPSVDAHAPQLPSGGPFGLGGI